MMYHLYFASCVPDGGIYHYVLEEGHLETAGKTDCDSPMYLEMRENSMNVILKQPLKENRESALTSYRLNPDGSLKEQSPAVGTKGIEACHLCTFHGKTFVANYMSGSIFASDGTVKNHVGTGVHPTRQDGSHLHFVSPAPDGKCLLAVDLGLDSIYSYDENLNLLSQAHVPAGSGPRHLAFSKDGKTVFCANELASSVSVFRYSDTCLTLLDTVSVLEKDNPENTAAAIRVCGNYVYVSNRGEDAISCLIWDGEKLSLKSVTPCGGVSPRDFLIVEDWLFCTNERSDTVTIFHVEKDTLRKDERKLFIPAPLCVAAKKFL